MNFAEFWVGSSGGGPTPPDPPVPGTSNSLRFRGSNTGYLNKTFSNNFTDTRTISLWYKPNIVGKNGSENYLPILWGFDDNNFNGYYSYENEPGIGALYIYNGAWVNQYDAPYFRDPSAWYHQVVQIENGTTTKVWMNGELIISSTNGDWTSGTLNTFFIGTYGTSSDALTRYAFEGYMADVYCIDGQALEPTAFGRYNEDGVWVPREVDFTPAEMRYSDFAFTDDQTSNTPNFNTTTRDFQPQYPASNGFNGSTTTACAAAFANGWAIFRPAEEITVDDKVELMTGFSSGGAIWVNNADTGKVTGGSSEWVDLGDVGGTLTNLAVKATGSTGAGWRAIKVDGEIITNPFIWSATATFDFPGSQSVIDNGPSASDLASTNQNYQVTAEAIYGWDDTNDYAKPQPGNAWLIRFPTPITNVTSLRVSWGANEKCWLNGNDTGVIGTGTFETLHSGAPITVETIAGLFASGGTYDPTANNGFQKVEINGQVYIDGANPSYGANGFHLTFQDPDNLGLDTSGNGNNFTATGFVTERPANYTHSSTGSSNLNSYPNEANGVNAPFMEPSSYVYYSPAGAQSFIYDFHSPIVVTGSLEVIAQGSMDQSAGYGSNTVTIEYSDGSTTVSNFSDLTSPPVNSSTPGYITVSSPGDAITKIIVDNPAPAPAINGGFAGLKINGNKLLLSTTVSAADYDPMQDGPSQNYATLNPLNAFTPDTLYYANLKSSNPVYGSAGTVFVNRTFADNDKYYFEIPIGKRGDASNQKAYPHLQWVSIDATNSHSALANTTTDSYFPDGKPTWDAGDVLRIRTVSQTQFDLAKNDEDWVRVIYPMNLPYLFGITNSDNSIAYFNFGQQPLLYEVPEGWTTIQTQNLPDAPIANGRDDFQAIVGPGTGSDPAPGTILGAFSTTWSASGDGFGSKPPANAFSPDPNAYCNNNTGGQTITWDTSSFNLVGDLTISMRSGGGPYRMLIDGIEVIPTITLDPDPSDYTVTVNNPQSIVWDPQPNGGGGIYIYNFQLDGDNLRDGNILALAQQTFPNGMWWIKDRNNNTNHQLLDSVRGALWTLQPNTAQSEQEYSAPLGDSVAWCWRAGESSVTDNTGSIESQVCVNEEAGFSIVQWVGSGGFDSIGHGLGRRPGMVITKTRQADHWIVGIDGYTTLSGGGSPSQWLNTQSFVGTNWANGLILNSFNASTTYVASSGINISGNTMMGYVWAPVEGYSAFGQYQGNGLSDGPFIYTGFRPAFVMIKCGSSGTEDVTNWFIQDSTREPYNPCADPLAANTSLPEYGFSSALIDLVSNGFKLRGGPDQMNGNKTYVYAAFAENPFGGSNVSPANAR